MIIPIDFQFRLVFFSFISGIILGVLFDVYRVIRGFERINKVIIIIEDILFWIFISLVIFVFLYITNKAYIEFYVYLWIILGIMFYMKLMSKSLVSVHIKIIKVFLKIFRVFKNILFYPIQILINKVKKINK